jgi:hypothetical protein
MNCLSKLRSCILRQLGCLGLLPAVLLLAVGSAAAQSCQPVFVPGDGIPGVNGQVRAATFWDPDGPGPQQPRLVVGGQFTIAGRTRAKNLAMWDGQSWQEIGGGVDGPTSIPPAVLALCSMPNGDLMVGGTFEQAGTLNSPGLSRWNGSQWSVVGAKIASYPSHEVRALQLLPNGDLIAAGLFRNIGALYAPAIARWNGQNWSNIGDPFYSAVSGWPVIDALVKLDDGSLIAGGGFSGTITAEARCIARFDGQRWGPVGNGFNKSVTCLLKGPGGSLIAGGPFMLAGSGVGSIAKWDGQSWQTLGSDFTLQPLALGWAPDGSLIAGGIFSDGLYYARPGLRRWNGSQWTDLPFCQYATLATTCAGPDGRLYLGGDFQRAGSELASGVVAYDGSTFSPLGRGIGSSATSFAVSLPDGKVVAGGDVGVFRWNGVHWAALGDDPNSSPQHVTALLALPNGEIIAGSNQRTVENSRAARISRWSGDSWTQIAALDDQVNALARAANGDILAGGMFSWVGEEGLGSFIRWNGTTWTSAIPLAKQSVFGDVTGLAVLPNGHVMVCGNFLKVGGKTVNRIARWDGSFWNALGSGFDNVVNNMAVMPNGDIVVSGPFTMSGAVPMPKIARWNGSAWSSLSVNGGAFEEPGALLARSNGDLIVGGGFDSIDGVAAKAIARWNGSAWQPIGTGRSPLIHALVSLPSGGFAVIGGSVTTQTPDASSIWFSRWSESGVAAIALQPQPQVVRRHESVHLYATPQSGAADLLYRWQREIPLGSGLFVDLHEGPGGGSVGGGVVEGSAGSFPSPVLGQSARLTIYEAAPSDAARYRVVFSNGCGSVFSQEITVSVRCNEADVTADGQLDLSDFFEFFNCWDVSTSCADLDVSGELDLLDFFAFFDAFDAGC